ncbi:hypothetical protein C8A01DRAFT_21407 [Parachaetomium inaequale]|uniref:MARVEL domain-containing protein n=1 Tax=Parachaetomium inaequale TaxID=2588326 RepID=A0AAN6SLD0_9PEZI|nr:hypothetical protein C8A01DRAFT_21407 [Parachaetomium inaequale]
MDAISRGSLVALRIFQLICSVIVLGILAYLVHRLNEAGAYKENWIVYGIVLAPISTVFSLVFIAPFMYSFLAFPADFAFFVMWLVLFCLLITRTGVRICSSPWFNNYWGFYWDGWWNRPVNTGVMIAGCGNLRATLAFSCMAMFAFLVTAFLGGYVVSKHWSKRRRERQAGTAGTPVVGNPPTSQIRGPIPPACEDVSETGMAPVTHTTQPGTYVSP